VVTGLKPGVRQGVASDVVVVMCRRMPVCRKEVEEQKSDGGQHGGNLKEGTKKKVGTLTDALFYIFGDFYDFRIRRQRRSD
jgi:hypothetical protein